MHERRLWIAKADRAETIAAFVRICRNADRTELLRAINLCWPDIMIDELLAEDGFSGPEFAGREI